MCADYQHRLMFDGEGFGVLVSERAGEDDRVRPLDEVFKYALYDAGGGDLVVVKRGATDKLAHTRLQSMLSKYTEFRADIRIGPRKSTASFMCCKFNWPRSGAVIYLSLKCIYKQLGFTMFSGESWRWIDAGIARWNKMMEDFSLQGHIQWSCQVVSICETWGKGADLLISEDRHSFAYVVSVLCRPLRLGCPLPAPP